MGSSLKGKVALVTGGSSGLGLASARELAERGAKVVVTGRRGAELNEAVRSIGHEAYGFVADASNLQDLDRLYAEIRGAAGRLDIVFANAGGGDMMPLGAITEEHFDRIFATNVKGLLFTVSEALPLVKDGGSIVLCGSTTTAEGTENFSVYSASKAAVRNFARSWVLDLRTRGIRVNVISPGAVATPGLAKLVPPERNRGGPWACRTVCVRWVPRASSWSRALGPWTGSRSTATGSRLHPCAPDSVANVGHPTRSRRLDQRGADGALL